METSSIDDIGLIFEVSPASETADIPSDLETRFDHIVTVSYPPESSKNPISKSYFLNKALDDLDTPWVLWLRSGEKPEWESLEQLNLENDTACLAVLAHREKDYTFTHLEFRLVPNREEITFKGAIYPSLYPALQQYGLTPEDEDLKLSVISEPVQVKVNFSNEIIVETGHDALACGLAKLSNSKLDEAIPYFKKAIKSGELSENDLTAAYNALATVYFEQKNRKLCEETIEKSLEVSETQRTPYLLLTKLYENNMHWAEAYKALYEYLNVLAKGSIANFDSIMPLVQTHYVLGNLAYQAKIHDRALVHYQEFYDLKKQRNETVNPEVIETLLSYSIQLHNKKQAEKYFYEFFNDKLNKTITEEEWKIIDRKLALFQDKEWYDFVIKIYKKLLKNNANNKNIVRRWVAVLIKQGNIEEAQKLISEHKSFIS